MHKAKEEAKKKPPKKEEPKPEPPADKPQPEEAKGQPTQLKLQAVKPRGDQQNKKQFLKLCPEVANQTKQIVTSWRKCDAINKKYSTLTGPPLPRPFIHTDNEGAQ